MKKFQKINDENFLKDFIKINGFSFKRGNSSKKKKKKKERGKSHISKIVKQQGTHHLKYNPKFWSFVSKTPGSKVEKSLGYLPFKLR